MTDFMLSQEMKFKIAWKLQRFEITGPVILNETLSFRFLFVKIGEIYIVITYLNKRFVLYMCLHFFFLHFHIQN